MGDVLITNVSSQTVTSLVFSLACAASLLLRYRAPEVALLVTLPAYCFGYLNLAPLIALYYIATRREAVFVGWAAAAVTAFLYGLVSPASGGLPPTVSLDNLDSASPLECCVGPALAVVIGRSARARHEQLKEAQARHVLEERLHTQQALNAERTRLAREMHDTVSHKISLISLQAGALQVARPESVNVHDSAQRIQQLAAQTVTELHDLLRVLRTAEDTRAGPPSVPGFAGLGELVGHSCLSVHLDLPGSWPHTSREIESAVYRTVQEALTNIRKHAPGSAVEVAVTDDDHSLQVRIRNGPPSEDARPPGIPGSGQGLAGLAERARLLGGTLTAGPTPDGSYAVTAAFPHPREGSTITTTELPEAGCAQGGEPDVTAA
ncbi:sensor histidine kinase [Streptomyces vinaceus]|uniref:sensor histidine kinase n=1 Tax=Streptomyces vinaceus TaxID=1960 RepID=UPI0038086CC6